MPATSVWDPVLHISQIIALQALHYLTLSLLTPPFLRLFAEPNALQYEGGAVNVGMIMDWRQLASRPTGRITPSNGSQGMYSGAWGRLRGIGQGERHADPSRGWIIAACWLLACVVDIYPLYKLIRHPRMILDFALTLLFFHMVLTTYFSAAFPTSPFFYVVAFSGTAISVVIAEQLCVKREMREGLSVLPLHEEYELSGLERQD